MTATLPRWLLTLALLGPATALPNDGFYQGAGSTLMPVKSDAARVLRETLHIRPVASPRCHSVLLNGKPVKSFYGFPDCDISGFTNGPPIPFERNRWGWDECPGLVTYWSADATYEVEALRSVRDVQIGFPVPTWGCPFSSTDGRCDDAPLPGVVEFKTFIDGKRIAKTRIRELMLDLPPDRSDPGLTAKPLGYVWSMSLKKGRRYTLRTTYDFGVWSRGGFYEKEEYPLGVRPWFLPEPQEGITAYHLIYYLSPIRTWGEPPPATLQIRVDIPSNIPVTAFVPVSLRPSCLDDGVMYFDIEEAFPTDDLDLTYPKSPEKLPPMTTVEQWTAWRASLGGDAKLTCGLRDNLAKQAPEALAAKIRSTPCVPGCRTKR